MASLLNTMEKQFVPYFLVSKLIELGFTEFTPFAYYASFYNTSDNVKLHKEYSDEFQGFDIVLPAPLWQQAFDWFSIHHKISNSVMRVPDGMWVFDVFREDYSDPWECYYKSQEQARLACLEKLIELITPQLEDK